MRNIRLAACLATVGVLGVGAASASASEFESSTGGGATKGLSVSKQEEFKVYPMSVICTKGVTKGPAAGHLAIGVKSETLTDVVTYSACLTFGTLKVTVTKGEWEYNANGMISLLAPITITPSLLKCHYEIPPQSVFTKSLVTFEDGTYWGNTKMPLGQLKLYIYSSLQGMEYTAHGWPCVGPTGSTIEGKEEIKEAEESGSEGKFVGAIKEEITNGDLTWIK
jgi:hypothetical protein